MGCDSAYNLKTPDKFKALKEAIAPTTQYYTMFIAFLEKAVSEGNTKNYYKSREYLDKADNSLKELKQVYADLQPNEK